MTILVANAYPEQVQTVIDVACFGVYNSHSAFHCNSLKPNCAYYRASKFASRYRRISDGLETPNDFNCGLELIVSPI